MSKLLKYSMIAGVLVGVGSLLTPTDHALAYRIGWAMAVAVAASLATTVIGVTAVVLRRIGRVFRSVGRVVKVARYAFASFEAAMESGVPV